YGGHGFLIDTEDHVTPLHAQIGSKTTHRHVGHQHPLLGFEVELTGKLLGLIRGQVLHRHTQNAAALRVGFGITFSPLTGAVLPDDLVTVGHFHIGGGAFTFAQVFQAQFLADIGVGHDGYQFVTAVYGLPVDAEDHVAPLQACVVSGTVRLNA